MYHHTAPLLSTTRGGMRRLLKMRPPPEKFIRQAVDSGVYKGLPQNDPSNPQNRNNGRNQNYQTGGRRGAAIDRYPIEYEILRLNPSIPPPPNVTKKERKRELREMRKAGGQVDTVDRYVSRFMERYDAKMGCTRPISEEEREGYEYYKRTLGVGGKGVQNMGTKMGRKAPVLDQAYDFALRQYELVQASDQRGGDRMTEEESVRAVEEMLEADRRAEVTHVRQTAAKISRWRTRRDAGSTAADGSTASVAAAASAVTPSAEPAPETTPPPPASTIPSILSSKPRVIRALAIWGRRLRAVPYSRWTLGASTALDHWIAVDVLGMTERSWQQLLDGTIEGGAGRGKDIVAVRAMLFPETTLDDGDDGVDAAADDDGMGLDAEGLEDDLDQDYVDATDRSIDELLASLGGLRQDSLADDDEADDKEDYAAHGEHDHAVEETDLDSQVSAVVDELQEWRAKNQEVQFQDWDHDAKEEFGKWMTKYINLVTPNEDDESPTKTHQIDLDATREALLAEPPRTRDQSNTFFSRVQDETQAEILLDRLTSLPPEQIAATAALDTDTQQAFAAFLKMPRELQLQHLLNLGTLRPVLDEFTLESDRLKFMEHYSSILLEGVELEHLVSDPDGTITGGDIGDDDLLKDVEGDGKDARFRIEMLAYGTDHFGTKKSERARALYRAWNIHKAGRAKYQEFLYKSGKIRLEDGAQSTSVGKE